MFIANAAHRGFDRQADPATPKPEGLRPVAAILDSWWQQQAAIGGSVSMPDMTNNRDVHATSLPQA